jgi:hypothetical protein
MKINSLSDNELVCNLQGGIDPEESLGELVQRHSGIFITMVNNYSPTHTSGIVSNRRELLKDRNYYIYKAAIKYDENRNTKFSTHLGNETRWLCLNIYNKNKNSKEVYLDISNIANKEQSIPDENKVDLEILSKIMSIINKDPDSRVSKIFKMRYIDGQKNSVMPWNKICKPLKLSIQGCINIHDKAINKIKKQLKGEL